LSAGRRRKWISHAPPGSRTIHASFRTAGPERWKDSSDGHGIETQVPTINGHHGSNYFGLKKGVSSYTLVANHILAFWLLRGKHCVPDLGGSLIFESQSIPSELIIV
jgi:Tn3 transposase DDE domain